LIEIFKTDSSVSGFALQRNRAQNWLYHRLGIDHAIGFTILARGWGSLAGLIPVALIACFLSRAQQGYFFAEALYLRAHKQEKFLLNSILGALLVGASTFFLGRSFGAIGVVSGSLIIGLVMGLPLGTYTFLKYRRAWHEN
jgi:hypothetical protein